jgi:thioredoxin 1
LLIIKVNVNKNEKGKWRREEIMGSEIILNDSNFDQEVLLSEVPVLVDFWAPWCAPCRMLAPIIEELAGEYAGKVKIGKLNVDENQSIAARYGVRGIPALILFNKGGIAAQSVGLQPKPNIKDMINNSLV